MRTLKLWILFWCALGVGADFGLLADEKKKGGEPEAEPEVEAEGEKEETPGERMAAGMKGYEAGMREYFTKSREAKTDEERAGLMMPDGAAAAREVLEVVKTAPDDPKAMEAVTWAVQVGSRDAEVLADVMAVVKNHFVNTEGVELICLRMVYFGGENSVGLLEHVRKKSGREAARASATFALGRIRADAGDEEGAVALFEEVVKKYPEAEVKGKGLAEMAGGEVFVIKNLSVGKVAPEIEGTKADGKEFKLSDTRGRVVVLDFFGHW